MKRLVILGIIACVGLLFGSAPVIGGPAGPPGGLDVNVVNPIPLPVTIPSEERPIPFQTNFDGGSFDVPVGKVAEVDFVYWYCAVGPSAQMHYVSVHTQVDGEIFVYKFPGSQVPGENDYTFSSRVKIIADGGTSIVYGTVSSGGLPSCDVYISGYLLND